MTREPSPLLPDATIRDGHHQDAPLGAAEALWFDLSDRLDATPQRRRRLMVAMAPGMRVAFAAIAVIAVVGGSVYLLGPTQGVGVPAATRATDRHADGDARTVIGAVRGDRPGRLDPYTSSRFAYSVEYPAAWIVIPATEDWTSVYAPDHGGPRMDYIGAKPFGSRIYLSSVPLTPDRDAAAWMSTLDSHTAGCCDPTSDRHTITIDAVTMRQEISTAARPSTSSRSSGRTTGGST